MRLDTVTDLDLAPRNSQGFVDFSTDLYILQPAKPAKRNGTILFEVVNRGKKGMLGMFHRSRGDDFGDGLFLNEGYTLVWVGWQWSIDGDRLQLTSPATGHRRRHISERNDAPRVVIRRLQTG